MRSVTAKRKPKRRAMRKRSVIEVLRYTGGSRSNSTARNAFRKWRAAQQPPIPDRCDNEKCTFFSAPLMWNEKSLPLILAHKNGVNSDNRTSNLQLLCPNCDAQDITTRGGANARRVTKSPGGFALKSQNGRVAYEMPAETGYYSLRRRPSDSLVPPEHGTPPA